MGLCTEILDFLRFVTLFFFCKKTTFARKLRSEDQITNQI